MTDENTSSGALDGHPALAAMLAKINSLETALAKYTGANIVEMDPNADTMPRYRLNEACYIDDKKWQEGEEITFTGTPNTAMVPLNELARKRMSDFITGLTAAQERKLAQLGRTNGGVLMVDIGEAIALQRQEAVRQAGGNMDAPKGPPVAMPVDKGSVPAMPHTPDAQVHMRRTGQTVTRTVVASKSLPMAEKPKPVPVSSLQVRVS